MNQGIHTCNCFTDTLVMYLLKPLMYPSYTRQDCMQCVHVHASKCWNTVVAMRYLWNQTNLILNLRQASYVLRICKSLSLRFFMGKEVNFFYPIGLQANFEIHNWSQQTIIIVLLFCLFYIYLLIDWFELGFLCVALATLELTLDPPESCLWNAGLKVTAASAWCIYCF